MPSLALARFIHESGLVSLTGAQQIAAHFTQQTLVKNQLLLKAGQIADHYFFLEAGYLRAFAEDTTGQEVTTGFYMPGQVVFEVTSFFNRSRSKENIQALGECEGWFITYQQLNELFHAMPEFREFGRAMLVKGFSDLKSRLLATITETAEERYRNLLLTQPDLLQHASQKHIASYLGVTDTSLSRIRASLVKK